MSRAVGRREPAVLVFGRGRRAFPSPGRVGGPGDPALARRRARALAAAAASETKKTLEAQWSSFQAEGRVPPDPFPRELAAAAAAREEEAAALRAAVAATARARGGGGAAEAEKSATLAELHEKARLVAAKDAEARAAEAEAAALEADLPPTAAVVAAADAGLDLKSLSLRIARDLDASVDRVARAARGERFVEPEPHRVPEALPSHPYPMSPRRWRRFCRR